MNKIKLKLVEIFYGYRCNLSCRGCSSASDIVKTTVYDPSIESIFTSIENLAKYIEPESIDLMGGELFLYWDKVEQIVSKIRQHFPDTQIALATNGLLLDKYKDSLLRLCEENHPCVIDITDHFTLFSKDIKAKKYHKKLDEFLAQLTTISVSNWPNPADHLKEHKSTEVDDWQRYFIEKKLYSGSSTTVKVYNQQKFVSCYYPIDEKIKPYATNDPDGSYAHGCAMPYCHLLVDSKLYKCSWFAVLPRILEKYNQLHDPDWQKYLKYQPIDLSAPTQTQLDQFEETSTRSIELCDMCSNNKSLNGTLHNKTNVFPVKFKNK